MRNPVGRKYKKHYSSNKSPNTGFKDYETGRA
jgi:hypothetical protein